ncbi:hypothetical protein SLE2022_069010 [Rubroshorea leprosula]
MEERAIIGRSRRWEKRQCIVDSLIKEALDDLSIVPNLVNPRDQVGNLLWKTPKRAKPVNGKIGLIWKVEMKCLSMIMSN